MSVGFAATGLASGNQARPHFALGGDDPKYPARCICTQGDKALFCSGIRIFDGESPRIGKRLLSVSEADAEQAQISPGLG